MLLAARGEGHTIFNCRFPFSTTVQSVHSPVNRLNGSILHLTLSSSPANCGTAQRTVNGVALNFEAAVAGGIPVIKTLRESLAGNQIKRVYGILNGTCNYILTRMEREGLSFTACLAEAQRLGIVMGKDAVDGAAALATASPLHPRELRAQKPLDRGTKAQIAQRMLGALAKSGAPSAAPPQGQRLDPPPRRRKSNSCRESPHQ